MKTEDLVVQLARQARPVKPFAPPAVRLAAWMTLALACGAAGVAAFGLRSDAATMMTRPGFVETAVLALTAMVLAGATALVAAIPGAERSALPRAAAIAAVTVWAAFLIFELSRAGHGFARASDWPICFARVTLIGAIPGAMLFAMLRRSAPLRLEWAGALAAIASIAVGALAIQFVCPAGDPAHVLLGHFGPVAVLGAAGAFFGRKVFSRRR